MSVIPWQPKRPPGAMAVLKWRRRDRVPVELYTL